MKILEIFGKLLLLFLLIQLLGLPGVLFLDSPNTLLFLQTFALIGASLLMFVLFERKRGWHLGVRQEQEGLRFLQGTGLGVGCMLLVFLLIFLFGGVQVVGVNGSGGAWKSVLTSLALFIMVGISEEILARGYTQGLVSYLFSPAAAWIVSSAFFALLHGSNPGVWDEPLPMINIFLAGLLLAVYRDVSGGLWGPIGFHFTWNFFQGSVFGFAVSGLDITSLIQLKATGNTTVSGGSFGAEGSIFATIVLLAVTFWIWRFGQTKRKQI
ncbi:CPBP family intramembrane glutamic endopeptidase [Paenactinomyces guangxiensis]|uniref:CPBP family intramembrane metalloprotease n=1 Tax=Paenactinomyces guangxiensis TaxID=1490290 RepID=A0A7W1WPC9_9BACL|nr:CPBP family intramembrane glutamic endopeptidase [Paenactinomyces guangxiensis]MBA4493596.1 CPBP family intramembrane metalloprotease [Paenactinomyces guangxiensis]MBH8590883.1 CPBP family intramembrane metalloprotease [Paenactinomyces guangxiensis]